MHISRWGRIAAAVVLAAHGLLHGLGVALLWRLGEPGALSYADIRPAPGSVAGVLVGAGWLAAAVLFVAAGLLVLRAGRWRPVAAAATVLSLAVIVPSAGVAVAGLLLDVVVLAAVAASGARARHRPAAGRGGAR